MKTFKIALVASTFAAGSAFAALPAEVTTALTEAKADGIAIGTAVLLIVIAIAAFKYLRSAK